MTYPITAEIENAVILNYKTCTKLAGLIYKDKHERFKDGSPIQTSPILMVDEEEGVVFTVNSVYKVNSWAEKT